MVTLPPPSQRVQGPQLLQRRYVGCLVLPHLVDFSLAPNFVDLFSPIDSWREDPGSLRAVQRSRKTVCAGVDDDRILSASAGSVTIPTTTLRVCFQDVFLFFLFVLFHLHIPEPFV